MADDSAEITMTTCCGIGSEHDCQTGKPRARVDSRSARHISITCAWTPPTCSVAPWQVQKRSNVAMHGLVLVRLESGSKLHIARFPLGELAMSTD